MAPDLNAAAPQEDFGVAWDVPQAQSLIPEGFPGQPDLSGLEEMGQGSSEGWGSSGSCRSCECYEFQMENFGIFLVAELSLLCERWALMVCFVKDFCVLGWKIWEPA